MLYVNYVINEITNIIFIKEIGVDTTQHSRNGT